MIQNPGRGGENASMHIFAYRIRNGFTLAELLIALAIFGVLATFTIPKVLTSSNQTQWKAVAKDAASIIAQAYQSYTKDYGVGTEVTGSKLEAYINYTKIDTSSTIYISDGTTRSCGDGLRTCLTLHNGSVLAYFNTDAMEGKASTSALPICIIPQLHNPQATNLLFFIYSNGRILDRRNTLTNTTWCQIGNVACQSYTGNLAHNPSWFSWN
jgi:prepilin-type N-terminal cleavage/methylation domain-containing protein